MASKVEYDITQDDINDVRATLIIPITVTIICVMVDIFAQVDNDTLFVIKVAEGSSQILIVETMHKVINIVLSYFFPTFISASVALLWEYYLSKTKKWTGLKVNKAFPLFWWTLGYLIAYFVYLMFMKFISTVFFTMISIGYAVFVFKCIDSQVFKVNTTPKNKVVHTPS